MAVNISLFGNKLDFNFNNTFVTSRRLLAIIVFTLCFNLVNFYFQSDTVVFKTPRNRVSININPLQGFIPHSLKGILKPDTWFIIEKNRNLWVYHKGKSKWVETKHDLSHRQLKDLKRLIKKITRRSPPLSVLVKRPMKLKKFKVYYVPWHYR